jgi:glycosyltransferase involved in cell wall biosynthesis
MKWFTCTPKNFKGGQPFFDRDSGLQSRGFAALGVESRAVTLGPAMDGDLPGLIRASATELTSSGWWAGHRLDGVVFYSWGMPEHRPIAEAIMRAGIRLAQVTDTNGICSPLADWRAHIRSEQSHYWYEPRAQRLLRTMLKVHYTHTLGVLLRDLPIVRMMTACDYFLAATPAAARRFRRLVRVLRGAAAASRVRMVPIPVSSHFAFAAGDTKRDEVISVGRWNIHQKRVSLLTAAIEQAARVRTRTVFRIFGGTTGFLDSWHAGLPAELRDRIRLEGRVTNAELAGAYRGARTMLVSSAYEGCHNASAEALCCGCSVVGVDSPYLCALQWHVSRNSGRLAPTAEPADLAAALTAELAAWDAGERNPAAISAAWTATVHPDQTALQILELFGMAGMLQG